MKRLTSLWRELAHEWAGWCGTSAERDCETVSLRTEMEGESFLTITLPQFDKAFTRSLELGRTDSSLFTGFQCRGGLPLFLGGFLSQIFSPTGVLLDEPSIDSIYAVHHLTTVFGKIKRLSSNKRIARAMRNYVELEQELEAFDLDSLEEYLPQFNKAVTLLWGDVFSHVENSLLDKHHLARKWVNSDSSEGSHKLGREASLTYSGSDRIVLPMDVILGVHNLVEPLGRRWVSEFRRKYESGSLVECEFVDPSSAFSLIPRHGPGATADGLSGNAKFSVNHWPQRLENVFPYGDYAFPQLGHEDELDRVKFLEPATEMPVKVIAVAKTDKTPRLIAKEPTAMQYTQQALFSQVVYRLEHSREFPPPLGGKEFDLGKWFIGFADQEANRFLARKGSLDGMLATLDLSEASDRVLNAHVQLLFSRFPRLSEAIQATRSTRARVQGHGDIPLSKFSSMGSALCFPAEAMVFVTIIICAIAQQRGVPVNRRLLQDLRGKVRVYGDDIVVPVDCVQRVVQFLEAFGLRVNTDKSFWNGKFRESCGGDYYDGEWVTPIRLRHELPRSLADVEGVVGLVAFRNLLYQGGFWKTVSVIDDRIRSLFRGRFPVVDETAAGLGRHSVAFSYIEEWQDDELHDPRVAGAIVRHTIPKSVTSGEGGLVKFLIKPGVLPSQDKKHLTHQGRPVASRIKLRGIRPY